MITFLKLKIRAFRLAVIISAAILCHQCKVSDEMIIRDMFFACGSSGFWWSSTEAGSSSAYYRNLIYSFTQVARDTHPKKMGFSVRCLKND